MRRLTRPEGHVVHVLRTTGPLSFEDLIRGLYCPSSLAPFNTSRGPPAPGTAEARLMHKLETGLMLHTGQLVELEDQRERIQTALSTASPSSRAGWIEGLRRVNEAHAAAEAAQEALADGVGAGPTTTPSPARLSGSLF